MGIGTQARERRVVYEYSFKRSQHDNRAINKMIERAEAVAAGTRPLKKDRFVKITDAVKGVDWDLVERARYLAGLKGYVTNIDANTMDGQQVVAAYRELYQVERSFRMAKSDLAARPMFHRIRDSIEAHLTIVFAALAVSREAQARTGVSIKKIVQTLRPLRTATISLGHQQITAPPRIPDHAQAILHDLTEGVVTKPIQLRSDGANCQTQTLGPLRAGRGRPTSPPSCVASRLTGRAPSFSSSIAIWTLSARPWLRWLREAALSSGRNGDAIARATTSAD
jgi:hypothetical protein